MDLAALISRYLWVPLYYETFGPTMRRARHTLARSQYFSEERIREEQWRSLRRMLRYAYEHTDFYRLRFEREGMTPDDVRSWSDFARLPVLTKDDLRSSGPAMVSDEFDIRHLMANHTGGSTGVPVVVYRDRKAHTVKLAIHDRHDAWAGFVPGQQRAALWGDVKPPRTLRQWLGWTLLARTIYLDTLEMDERRMLAFAERIRRTRTRLLFGHAHSIYFFARFLQEKGIGDLGIRRIISTAETLTAEERRVIEEVFGNSIFDRYGCAEIGLIASECEARTGLHVAAESVHVEILNDGPAGAGRVVITDLSNRAMPIIRYEIGDLATPATGACPCGRGLPRLERVVGRTSDILYTPDGRWLSGISILDTVMIHIPGLRQVQVVQERLDELVFYIVRGDRFSDESLKMLAESVTRYFGPAMNHRVALVDAIPLTGRGKFQFSINKLRISGVLGGLVGRVADGRGDSQILQRNSEIRPGRHL
jgi:phenylacetate-CoA ligase